MRSVQQRAAYVQDGKTSVGVEFRMENKRKGAVSKMTRKFDVKPYGVFNELYRETLRRRSGKHGGGRYFATGICPVRSRQV